MESKQEQATTNNGNSLRNGLLRIASVLAIPAAMLAGSFIGSAVAPENYEVYGALVGTITPPLVALGVLLAEAWNNRNDNR